MEELRKVGENQTILTQEKLNQLLLELTEQDPTGLALFRELCVPIEANLMWTKEGKELVYEAIELADYTHNGQRRGDDEYFGHPVRVAIRLYTRNASPEQVAAGLLHDAVEDNPLAVIAYLLGNTKEFPSFIGPKNEEQIEIAIAMLYDSEVFSRVAPYVDAVTNRPYPPEIADAKNKTKHKHRAATIHKLNKEPNKLIVKDCDNYDNVVMLWHHEALSGKLKGSDQEKAMRHLEKLLNKYTIVLDAFEEIAREGNSAVSLESVNYRRSVIEDVRYAVHIASSPEMEAIAA